MALNKEREYWVDIAKGIGIILVVLGHSNWSVGHHYIFWFHMPLFFILSGYVAKHPKDWGDFTPWLIKRAKQLLIPYLAFALLFLLVLYGFDALKGKFVFAEFLQAIADVGYGGILLGGPHAVFWFITCLLVTQTLFAALALLLRSHKTRWGIILIFYFLAHLAAVYCQKYDLKFPWNADVALLTLTYYAVGFYLKGFMEEFVESIWMFLLSVAFCFGFIWMDLQGLVSYDLDLKTHLYTHVTLDLVVPLFFCMILFWIAKRLEAIFVVRKALVHLGMTSMSIMYLHMMVNITIGQFVAYGPAIYTMLGIVIPLIVKLYFFDQFAWSRYLFLSKLTAENRSSGFLSR